MGTLSEPKPVTGLAENFSPMPLRAPPPLGSEMTLEAFDSLLMLLSVLDFADNDVVASEIALNRDALLDVCGLDDYLRLWLRLCSQVVDFDTKNPEDGSDASGACPRGNGSRNRWPTGEFGRDA